MRHVAKLTMADGRVPRICVPTLEHGATQCQSWKCKHTGGMDNCRACGFIFCSKCLARRDMPAAFRHKGDVNPVRVCKGCDELIDQGAVLTSQRAKETVMVARLAGAQHPQAIAARRGPPSLPRQLSGRDLYGRVPPSLPNPGMVGGTEGVDTVTGVGPNDGLLASVPAPRPPPRGEGLGRHLSGGAVVARPKPPPRDYNQHTGQTLQSTDVFPTLTRPLLITAPPLPKNPPPIIHKPEKPPYLVSTSLFSSSSPSSSYILPSSSNATPSAAVAVAISATAAGPLTSPPVFSSPACPRRPAPLLPVSSPFAHSPKTPALLPASSLQSSPQSSNQSLRHAANDVDGSTAVAANEDGGDSCGGDSGGATRGQAEGGGRAGAFGDHLSSLLALPTISDLEPDEEPGCSEAVDVGSGDKSGAKSLTLPPRLPKNFADRRRPPPLRQSPAYQRNRLTVARPPSLPARPPRAVVPADLVDSPLTPKTPYKSNPDEGQGTGDHSNFSIKKGKMIISPPEWDETSTACNRCRKDVQKPHKHNCRTCGLIFCSNCSHKVDVPVPFRKKGKKNPVRVCVTCYVLISLGKAKLVKEAPAAAPSAAEIAKPSRPKSKKLSAAASETFPFFATITRACPDLDLGVGELVIVRASRRKNKILQYWLLDPNAHAPEAEGDDPEAAPVTPQGIWATDDLLVRIVAGRLSVDAEMWNNRPA